MKGMNLEIGYIEYISCRSLSVHISILFIVIFIYRFLFRKNQRYIFHEFINWEIEFKISRSRDFDYKLLKIIKF